jgi:hypothetical protein
MPAISHARPMPPIAVHWIKANVLAAIVLCGATLASYAVRRAVGAEDAGLGVAVALHLADIASWVLAGLAYGVLTGAVLQRIVPNLPARAWIALQAALFCISAVESGIGFTAALVSIPAAADDNGLFETVILFVGALVGAILGALGGGAEALVLRRAASGTVAWIGWSTLAYAIVIALFIGCARLWDTGSDFAGELIWQVLTFVGAMIIAVVMLPAVRRLKDPLLSKAGAHFD